MLSHLKRLLCACFVTSICSLSLLSKYCESTEMHKENTSVKQDLGQNLLEIFYFIDPVFPVNQRIFRKICHLHSTQHWLWIVRLDDTHNHDVFTCGQKQPICFHRKDILITLQMQK